MNKSEKKQLEDILKFNQMRYQDMQKDLKERPNDFNLFAEMKYYEGLLVGLTMRLAGAKD